MNTEERLRYYPERILKNWIHELEILLAKYKKYKNKGTICNLCRYTRKESCLTHSSKLEALRKDDCIYCPWIGLNGKTCVDFAERKNLNTYRAYDEGELAKSRIRTIPRWIKTIESHLKERKNKK